MHENHVSPLKRKAVSTVNIDHKSIWALCIVGAPLLLLFGCAQPDGPVGSGVGGRPEGHFRSVVCPALADTSYIVARVGTGGSANLYVGASHDVSSYAISKYYRPVKPYEITVDSARMTLAWEGGIGDGAMPAIEGNLAVFSWSESTVPADADVPTGTRLDSRIDRTTAAGDTGSLSFTVPVAEVASWLAWIDSSSIDTNWVDSTRLDAALSLVVKAPAAVDRLVRFKSRSATGDSLRPKLLIYATIKDSASDVAHDSLYSIVATSDMFITTNTAAPLPNRLVLGGGAAVRSALKFDMTPVYAAKDTFEVVVNRAVLTLHRDRAAYTWAPWSKSVWPYRMTSNLWLTYPDSAAYSGFVLSPTAVDSSADTLQLVVTSPAASWASADSLNFGLLLMATSEGLDIERIAFFDQSAVDPALRPSLKVYYTELPK